MFVKIWEVERHILQGEKKVHVKQAVIEKKNFNLQRKEKLGTKMKTTLII